jgi:hypothetical protein
MNIETTNYYSCRCFNFRTKYYNQALYNGIGRISQAFPEGNARPTSLNFNAARTQKRRMFVIIRIPYFWWATKFNVECSADEEISDLGASLRLITRLVTAAMFRRHVSETRIRVLQIKDSKGPSHETTRLQKLNHTSSAI